MYLVAPPGRPCDPVHKPTNATPRRHCRREALGRLRGVGAAKLERYGDAFLAVIAGESGAAAGS